MTPPCLPYWWPRRPLLLRAGGATAVGRGGAAAVVEGRRGGDGWAEGPARGAAAAATGPVVEGAGEPARPGWGSEPIFLIFFYG